MKVKILLLSLFMVCLTDTLLAQINTEIVESLIQEKVDKDFFTGTVLIADDGEIVLQKSYGFADIKNKVSISNTTQFGIASITKMITAILTLQLVQERSLALDDPLIELLPGLDIPNNEEITVHHLLLHISGLPNEKNSIYRSPISPTEFVTEVLKNPGYRAEFGSYNYSNIDYVLLGLIIEDITGESWEERVRNRILEPLNMNQTGFLSLNDFPEEYARTYSVRKTGKLLPDPSFHIENYWASGNMYSTAEDLLKLDQAMYGDKLLSDEMKEAMFTSYPEYNYTGYSVWTYNYPFLDNYPKIMERRGGIMGSNSVLVRVLDSNKTIIILSNNDRFNPDSFGDENNLREALIREIAK